MTGVREDAEQIMAIFGDRYHRSGCGAAAVVVDGTDRSMAYDGDALVLTDAVADLAAHVLAKRCKVDSDPSNLGVAFLGDVLARIAELRRANEEVPHE